VIGVRRTDNSPIAESAYGSIGVTVTGLAAASTVGEIPILTFITKLTCVSRYTHTLTCDRVTGIWVL